MLAVENRQTSDLRTLGEIFYCISDELSDITLIHAFHLLMQVFLDTITDKLSLTSQQLDQLLEAFMAALPIGLRKLLLNV